MPPRRTSQAVKKDTEATETKNEGSAPRRSGRAVSKPETSAREASRSRRSSTAAQTAASVADSRTPKARGSVSSRRDSTSPSDLPASRVKAVRRSTGRINYKESDGEEEVATPKVDENFNSGDEFDDSESDEKSKPKGKGKVSKSPAKGRKAAKSKASPRSRRGRPSKKKSIDDEEEEEKETVEISDDSGEIEEVGAKKTKEVKEKEPSKPSRSRRQRSEVTEIKLDEEKPKSSRRSSRGVSNKEDSPKKRPARNVQAKRYAEDDDVEEIDDTKQVVEEVDEGKRKRKRGSSPEEPNKRLKEDDDDSGDVKEVAATDETAEEKEAVPAEPMEVDEPDLPEETSETKSDGLVGSNMDMVPEDTAKEIAEDKEMPEESLVPPEEKVEEVSEQENVERSEIIDQSKDNLISEIKPKGEEDKLKGVAAAKETPKAEEKPVEKIVEIRKAPEIANKSVDEVKTTLVASDIKPAEIANKVESAPDPLAERDDACKSDSPSSDECKPLTIDETASASSPTTATIPQPKETNQEAVLNGSEKSDVAPNTVRDIVIGTSTNLERIEKSTPTENGAHNDMQHTNSTSPASHYFTLPGRKYVSNSGLTDSARQSVKDQTLGFVSYNLGTSGSDAYLQKEKLLNELNSLDARIICLQQVAKPFYSTVLQPSLDALGFKSIFSQPEDSLKGVATFYKSSLFRPTKKTEISLKQLVEKELETSSLSLEDRAAVKTHIKKCGNVLFMQFATVVGTWSLTVANVQIPPTDLSVHALQVSCLAREVVRINGGTNMPLLLGGEFNLSENDASYQLLRDGYLSNDMIEELQQRKDIALPGKENESLVNLLWNLFQHPSSNLCSCYKSVLGHEFSIPETKRTSPDLLWFSSNSLHLVGVLDVVLDKPVDRHFSLKADVAFSA